MIRIVLRWIHSLNDLARLDDQVKSHLKTRRGNSIEKCLEETENPDASFIGLMCYSVTPQNLLIKRGLVIFMDRDSPVSTQMRRWPIAIEPHPLTFLRITSMRCVRHSLQHSQMSKRLKQGLAIGQQDFALFLLLLPVFNRVEPDAFRVPPICLNTKFCRLIRRRNVSVVFSCRYRPQGDETKH